MLMLSRNCIKHIVTLHHTCLDTLFMLVQSNLILIQAWKQTVAILAVKHGTTVAFNVVI